MSKIDNDGPATGYWKFDENGNPVFTPGATLRDYFAAEALSGLAMRSHGPMDSADHYARIAYEWADAMLEARK